MYSKHQPVNSDRVMAVFIIERSKVNILNIVTNQLQR